jgi:hypothetical protein
MNIGVIQKSTSDHVVDEIGEMILNIPIRKHVQATRKVKTWKDFCKMLLKMDFHF